MSDARTEASIEKLGKRSIAQRLDLGHVDLILADERLNLARTQARVLIESVEPVIDRLRLDPLRKGALRLALVVGLDTKQPAAISA